MHRADESANFDRGPCDSVSAGRIAMNVNGDRVGRRIHVAVRAEDCEATGADLFHGAGVALPIAPIHSDREIRNFRAECCVVEICERPAGEKRPAEINIFSHSGECRACGMNDCIAARGLGRTARAVHDHVQRIHAVAGVSVCALHFKCARLRGRAHDGDGCVCTAGGLPVAAVAPIHHRDEIRRHCRRATVAKSRQRSRAGCHGLGSFECFRRHDDRLVADSDFEELVARHAGCRAVEKWIVELRDCERNIPRARSRS